MKNKLFLEIHEIEKLTNDNITLMKQISRLQEDFSIKIDNNL
jgi:hypothetical protein